MNKDETREELEQEQIQPAEELNEAPAFEEHLEEAPAEESAEEAAEEVAVEVAAEPSFEDLLKEAIEKDAGSDQPEDVPDEDELRATAVLDEDLVRQVLSSTAFEDMQSIGEADDPMIYRNFSNGYGKNVKKLNAFTKMSKEDRVRTVLMFIAAGLCLGIIAVLIYWLVHFF